MRSRNRELNVFSMSALDLFASAMGAFMILAIISLPYFGNTHRISDQELLEEAAKARADAQTQTEARERAERELAECQSQRQQAENELRVCQRKNFLLITMSWAKKVDIDLHVTDPEGREYFYEGNARMHRGSQARFEEDNISGPGNEIWLHPDVTPGVYLVEYVYFSNQEPSAHPPAVPVRGTVLHNSGRIEIPVVTLESPSRDIKIPVARIKVDENGGVSLL